jgi:phosphatidylinositol dimannoside acyltransferase
MGEYVSPTRHMRFKPAVRWRGFQLAALFVRFFPDLAEILARPAANAAYLVGSRQRRSVSRNLRVLEPNATAERVQAVCRSVFLSVARYYVELLRIPGRRLDGYFSRMEVNGYEHLSGALERKKGVIIAGIHIGPAEIVLHGLAARGIPYTTVVEHVEPPQLAGLLQGIRQSHGQRYLYPDLAGTKQLIRTLRRGGLVALLVDRDILGSGIEVRFCGGLLRAPAGPIELARLTGAAIVPAVARWTAHGEVAVAVLPEFQLSARRRDDGALRSDMERLLAVFEPHLRLVPGQWLVLEPLWKIPRRSRAAAYTKHHPSGRPTGREESVGGRVGDSGSAHPYHGQ